MGRTSKRPPVTTDTSLLDENSNSIGSSRSDNHLRVDTAATSANSRKPRSLKAALDSVDLSKTPESGSEEDYDALKPDPSAIAVGGKGGGFEPKGTKDTRPSVCTINRTNIIHLTCTKDSVRIKIKFQQNVRVDLVTLFSHDLFPHLMVVTPQLLKVLFVASSIFSGWVSQFSCYNCFLRIGKIMEVFLVAMRLCRLRFGGMLSFCYSRAPLCVSLFSLGCSYKRLSWKGISLGMELDGSSKVYVYHGVKLWFEKRILIFTRFGKYYSSWWSLSGPCFVHGLGVIRLPTPYR